MKPYTHILFDNDGVLVDTEKLYFAATRSAFQQRTGIDIDWSLFEANFLADNKGTQGLLDHFGISHISYDELVDLRDSAYADTLTGNIPILNGVMETLKTLQPHVKMSIVTSCKRHHFEAMHKHTGIIDYMDFIIANEDVTFTKPHPEPYLKGAEQFNVDPADILVVEDSARGLASAVAAGIDCAVIPQYTASNGQFDRATYQLKSITALAGIISTHSNE